MDKPIPMRGQGGDLTPPALQPQIILKRQTITLNLLKPL